MTKYIKLLEEFNCTIPEERHLVLHSIDTSLKMIFVESPSNGANEDTKAFSKFVWEKTKQVVASTIYCKTFIKEKPEVSHSKSFMATASQQRL